MQKIKAAICVLTKGYEDLSGYDELIERNRALFSCVPFDGTVAYEMIVFHEGNIPEEHARYIEEKSGNIPLQFISAEKEFKKKPHAGENRYCHETETSKRFGHGYRCMCRFWFFGFIDYLKPYDYAIRVDEDCIVTQFPLTAVIKEMQEKNIRYVTPTLRGKDREEVVTGLQQFTKDFCKEHNLARRPAFDKNPYTNVFVLDLPFFRNNELFRAFSKAVDETRCIEINRWGDLPLWGAALSIEPEPAIMKVDRRIRYMHGSHNEYVNDPDPVVTQLKKKRSRLARIAASIKKRLPGQ